MFDRTELKRPTGGPVATLLLVVLVSGLLVLLLTGLAWRVPNLVESVYARRLGPKMGIALSGLSGRLPLGLAEWAVLFAPIAAGWLLIRAARIALGAGRPTARLARALVLLVAPPLALAAMFYLLWGLNYARPALEARLAWTTEEGEGGPPSVARDRSESELETSGSVADVPEVEAQNVELYRVAAQLVGATNEAYRQAHGSGDIGRPSSWRTARWAGPDAERDAAGATRTDGAVRMSAFALLGSLGSDPRRAGLDGAIDVGLAAAGAELGLDEAFGLARGPAKAVRNSWLLSRLQLAGFYFPWTGEANYNDAMPPMQQPHTIAHEKAHQRGIGSEDEANFLGFAGTLRAPEAYVRYSGLLFGQRQLLRELLVAEPEAAEALLAARLPGVQRDVDAANAYWRRFDGKPARLQREVNDRYLRANRVEGGIDSYRQSVQLILRWAEASGGRLPLRP